MGLFRKLDGAMQPIRWISSTVLFVWYGAFALLLILNDLMWAAVPFVLLMAFALWGIVHNSMRRYWYHD